MKILLVEDDLRQLEPLKTALTREKYIVDATQDGLEAQGLLSERSYDLLILDWMVPRVSGLELCRQYRAAGGQASVLILTARDMVQDKVLGLDSGADDYLVKPTDVIELLARVRALSRRSPLWQGNSLEVADLRLDLGNLIAERGTDAVQLTKREYQLLEYFLRHPRQVLTHNQIENALWEWDIEPESNAAPKLVRRLRQRLQALGVADWVETIYGMGYRLNPQTES
jgi:OmpR-family two-component system manganese-sensing response regulator